MICIHFESKTNSSSITANQSLGSQKQKKPPEPLSKSGSGSLYIKEHMDGRDHDLVELLQKPSQQAPHLMNQPQIVFVIGGFLLEFYSYPPSWLSIAEFWYFHLFLFLT